MLRSAVRAIRLGCNESFLGNAQGRQTIPWPQYGSNAPQTDSWQKVMKACAHRLEPRDALQRRFKGPGCLVVFPEVVPTNYEAPGTGDTNKGRAYELPNPLAHRSNGQSNPPMIRR